ncbi:MAG: hypothetical protein JSS96_06940 [Bacteroidetes bacterium]|nr:hypothetical protein [Bacteroidota bacterium]
MNTEEETYLGSPDNPRTAAVVSYITLIGWLIAYYALYRKNKNSFSAYHLRQTLLLHIIAFVINILAILSLWHLFSHMIVTLLALLLFILWLVGVYYVVNNKQKPIPIVGKLSQRLLKDL